MTASVPTGLLALGALAALVIATVMFRAMPKAGILVWALVLFLVPVWVGAAVGPHWSAIGLLTIVLVIANWSRMTFHPADALAAAFAGLVLILHILGEVGLGAALIVFQDWMIPYLWGRLVLTRVPGSSISNAISIGALIAAVLAILEFVTSFNPFVLIPGAEPLWSSWSGLQPRGGVLRAEGAFGHSIALGATLAMSTAFVVHSRWRSLPKIVTVAVIVAATVLTFSRAGQITIVLTLAASIALIPGLSRRFRITVLSLAAVGVGIALPVIEAVLGAAGDEAAGSAGYRSDLLVLLGQVKAFGDAGEWQTLVAGDHYLGFFADSVDNALLLALLRYGLVPTLLMSLVIITPVVLLLRRQWRSPAAIAVACQLPSLVVVALITQYGVAFWFCIGLAVAWGVSGTLEDGQERPVPPARAHRAHHIVSSLRGASYR
ncbi:hypothetical protein ACH0CV_09225 [Brachybacterium paraconglomeratum]|uniref:hypothetical protein n=1 Tax=Brachybacterium paraconglomeratum TaxID=173362 RepID=UPI003879EAE5